MIRRRSRTELDIGRVVHRGQRWRNRATQQVWQIETPHRKDCVVVLRDPAGHRWLVGFERLRQEFVLIVEPTERTAA